MKKNLHRIFIRLSCIASLFALCINSSYSQTLWGMTSDGGGKLRGGNIFSIKEDGTGFTERYAFLNDGTSNFGQRLLIYGDGYFYGVADDVLFRQHYDGSDYTILHFFEIATGTDASSPLTKGLDGYLYGTMWWGGTTYYGGVVYKVKIDGSDYQVLHNFNGADGEQPAGQLLQLNTGVLYGTTRSGGDSDHGTIYKINADGTGFTSLKSFNGTNGSFPDGGLITLTINNVTYLYGVADGGGTNDKGVIYRIEPDGSNYSKQYNFSSSSGYYPRGSLTRIGSVLYGVTVKGGNYDGGVLYAYDAAADSYQKLKHFSLGPYSFSTDPNGSLLAVNNVLYGTTADGGAYDVGILYKINTDGSGYQVLHEFSQGWNSVGSLLYANSQIYGLTGDSYDEATGWASRGSIYNINTDGTSYQMIHDFTPKNGYGPEGSLIIGQDIKLYGVTRYGGKHTMGMAFSIETNGNFNTVIWPGNSNESGPTGSMMQATNGSFYGMRYGTTFGGEIFRITTNSIFSQLTVYDPFCGGSGCAKWPYGSLMQASDGNLYGMTQSSDVYWGDGAIFRIGTDGTGFTIIKQFNGTDGANPYGSLIQAADGRLYGMTENGGANGFGTIFRIRTDGTGFQTIFEFGSSLWGSYGTHPKGSLLVGSDGRIYGMTNGGGSGWGGTIFRLNTDGSGFSVIYNFSSPSGLLPVGSLIEDVSNGYLFGMTEQGGAANLGTIFKLNKDGTGYQTLLHFDGFNGKYPKGDLLLVPLTINVIGPPVITPAAQKNSETEKNISSTNSSISIFPNPVKQSFTVRFQNSFSGRVDYTITDLSGKKLLQSTFNHSAFIDSKSIDISSLPSGTYLLELSTPNKKFTQKIVKQ